MLTIRQHAASANPLRTYNFLVTIPNPPGGGNGQVLEGRTQSAVLPGSSVADLESTRQGFTITNPGQRTYSRAMDIEFEETSNFDVLKALEAWEALVNNRETGEISPNAKTTVLLKLHKNNRSLGRTYRAHGVYLEAIADTTLSGSSGESMKITATFSYDFIVPA